MQIPTQVAGLTDEELAEFGALVRVWDDRARGNAEKMTYYLGKNQLKDLGISIPPSLKRTLTVVGWPAKAVDMLAARSMFDGFAFTGDGEDPLGLKPLLVENQFELLYEQAVRSQLIHCAAFWTLGRGDRSQGDPEVLISMNSAEYASALWDHRKRRIRSGLVVTDISRDDASAPTEITLYLADYVIVISRQRSSGRWVVTERWVNPLGRPLMEPMPFLPDFKRPFGRSRITREVRSITDSAQREALRAEVLMEIYTAPQRAIIGADKDSFDWDRWKTYMTSLIRVSRDDEGNVPSLVQQPQVSPQGAISYMQHLAMRFAGATGVPVSSLGVVQENPSSAQAIFAAKDDLVTTAQSLNRTNRIALANVARMAFALREGITLGELPREALTMQVRFRNPAMPSVVSQSDAMVKQISVMPWLGETEVALEELGYDEAQITRLLDAKRRLEGRNLVDSLLQGRAVSDVPRGRGAFPTGTPVGEAYTMVDEDGAPTA